jgi:hypothetical protein
VDLNLGVQGGQPVGDQIPLSPPVFQRGIRLLSSGKFLKRTLVSGTLAIYFSSRVSTEVSCYLSKLFEGGFEALHNVGGDDVRRGRIGGFFEGFISEPEDIGPGFDGSSSLRAFHQP